MTSFKIRRNRYYSVPLFRLWSQIRTLVSFPSFSLPPLTALTLVTRFLRYNNAPRSFCHIPSFVVRFRPRQACATRPEDRPPPDRSQAHSSRYGERHLFVQSSSPLLVQSSRPLILSLTRHPSCCPTLIIPSSPRSLAVVPLSLAHPLVIPSPSFSPFIFSFSRALTFSSRILISCPLFSRLSSPCPFIPLLPPSLVPSSPLSCPASSCPLVSLLVSSPHLPILLSPCLILRLVSPA